MNLKAMKCQKIERFSGQFDTFMGSTTTEDGDRLRVFFTEVQGRLHLYILCIVRFFSFSIHVLSERVGCRLLFRLLYLISLHAAHCTHTR